MVDDAADTSRGAYDAVPYRSSVAMVKKECWFKGKGARRKNKSLHASQISLVTTVRAVESPKWNLKEATFDSDHGYVYLLWEYIDCEGAWWDVQTDVQPNVQPYVQPNEQARPLIRAWPNSQEPFVFSPPY